MTSGVVTITVPAIMQKEPMVMAHAIPAKAYLRLERLRS